MAATTTLAIRHVGFRNSQSW